MTAQRYGFLGPAGTFTQMALAQWETTLNPGELAEQVPYTSVDTALAAVGSGELAGAMVPIENSVEGGVTATLDHLAASDSLIIVGEILVPVTFVLAARPGMRIADLARIGTHTHAWAQVRQWVVANAPTVEFVPTTSTAAAPEGLAELGDLAGYDAAICAPVAAANAGLEILAEDIGDIKNAVTRFAMVARIGALPPPTGHDKSTLVLFQKMDYPGGLLGLLEQFAVRGVNMTRLESRPTGEAMGQYCFSIDIEGHVADARVAESLVGLKRVCSDVRFLGSYARADRVLPTTVPGTEDADFDEAWSWIEQLRGDASD